MPKHLPPGFGHVFGSYPFFNKSQSKIVVSKGFELLVEKTNFLMKAFSPQGLGSIGIMQQDASWKEILRFTGVGILFFTISFVRDERFVEVPVAQTAVRILV
jgi:hypothetical protein